jgi:hypothetical protein
MARDRPRSGHVRVTLGKALKLRATTNEIKPLYLQRVKCSGSKSRLLTEGTVGPFDGNGTGVVRSALVL